MADDNPAAFPPAVADPLAAGGLLLGTCLDPAHPQITRRARIAWQDGQESRTQWLPVLNGVALASGDRVVLAMPCNADEPMVLGVLDGATRRPAPPEAGPVVALQPGQVVTVTDADGRPLLRLAQGADGPEVRLQGPGCRLATRGPLELAGDSVTIRATAGDLTGKAAGDVTIKGEMIDLN